ncbi:hypothetical protein ACFL2J_06930 [Candidatus Omnitrophota bacterium]
MKMILLVLLVAMYLYPLQVDAATEEGPLLRYDYEHIEWVSHTPYLPDEMEGEVISPDEADYRGQVDMGEVDVDGDGIKEAIKVVWGGGVSDHSLTIEVYKDDKLISTLNGVHGIQSNFKIKDADGDGRKEIIIWSGLWDFRMPGEDDITEDNYEGHSGPHRYVVATYKLIKGNEFRPDKYYLWDIYTTKKKYEPFCEAQPEEQSISGVFVKDNP